MYGRNEQKLGTNGQITRRKFLCRAGTLLGFSVAGAFIIRRLFPVAPASYNKGPKQRDFSAAPITVYKMVPLPGYRYYNADRGHMANKIFPSIEAARARRQHPAFFYGLKQVELAPSLVNRVGASDFFGGRKDMDVRVAADRRHCQKLGIDVDNIFEVVTKV